MKLSLEIENSQYYILYKGFVKSVRGFNQVKEFHMAALFLFSEVFYLFFILKTFFICTVCTSCFVQTMGDNIFQ